MSPPVFLGRLADKNKNRTYMARGPAFSRWAGKKINKAVIDRRLRPQCCHLIRLREISRASVACNWYSYAPFIAKPKAACELRLSWAATSSRLGLCANTTSSIKPEVRNISLRRKRKTSHVHR